MPIKKTVKGWAIFGPSSALAVCMLLASLGTSIANIALPAISEAFPAPFRDVQMVIIGYLVALTLAVVLAGRLGDIFGHKRMLVAGLLIYGIAAMICGFADNLTELVWARAGQGIGAAFLMSLTMVLVRETSDHGQVGRGMGLLGTMSAFGTALGPSLGGFLMGIVGWRSVFLCLFPITAFALLLVIMTLKKDAATKPPPITGFAGLYNKRLFVSLVVNLLVAAVMMTTLLVGPFYLTRALGLNETPMGLVMSVGPVVSIICGVPSGRLVDRRGTGQVMMFGLILLASGCFALAVLPGFIGTFGYILAIVILTPGYQLFQAANNTAIMTETLAGQRGVVSGALSLSRNLGLIFGASVMGMIFAAGVGTSEFSSAEPRAIASGMQLAFLIAGVLMLFSLAITRRSRAS